MPLAWALASIDGLGLCAASIEVRPGSELPQPAFGFVPDPPLLGELLACAVARHEGSDARPGWQVRLRVVAERTARMELERIAGEEDFSADVAQLAASLPTTLRVLAARRLHDEWLAAERPAGALSGLLELTAREREVLRRMLEGESTPTIARACFLSEHTVRNHVKNLAAKLEVPSQRAIRELFAH